MLTRGAYLALTLSILALAPAARAQTPVAVSFIELFQSLDADGDMVVSRGEVPESGREAFDRLLNLGDTNKDGKLDREEYRALLEKTRDAMAAGGVGQG